MRKNVEHYEVFCINYCEGRQGGGDQELLPWLGKLLGLLALHILALAIAEYHKIEQVLGIVHCDNEGAVNQSQVDRKRVRAGAKQADIL